jgi:hypothetical protein
LGKMGPYRPFSSVKYPLDGIAIAAGFVQFVQLISLGLAGPGVAMKVSLEGVAFWFLFLRPQGPQTKNSPEPGVFPLRFLVAARVRRAMFLVDGT